MKPLSADTPLPPLVFEGEGGRASITYLDGLPVLVASGSARFSLSARRRRPFKAKPARDLQVGEPSVPDIRKGDVVRLTFGSVEHAWRYDPDGNLPRPARWLMWLAREFAFTVVIAAVVALCVHVGTLVAAGSMGSLKDNPLPALMRSNLSGIYPTNQTEPSGYLREMARAKREGRDVGQASREWIEARKAGARTGEEAR